MEIEIYKENRKYCALINNKEYSNKDKYCLGLKIAHKIGDNPNKLESIILKKGKDIDNPEDIEIIAREIKNSAAYNGYDIDIR